MCFNSERQQGYPLTFRNDEGGLKKERGVDSCSIKGKTAINPVDRMARYPHDDQLCPR